MTEVTPNPKCSNCSKSLECVLYKKVMEAIEIEHSISDKDSIYSEIANDCKLYTYLRK